MNTTLLKTTIVMTTILVANIGSSESATIASAPNDASKQQSAKDTPTMQNLIKELAELGPGVHKVKKTENNVFKSCVVVGQARISTVLGISKGLETARRNAKLKAEAEFVSWLKTHTASVRSLGDETEFTLKGDGDKESETGTSSETSTETITSSAQGAVRGLTLIGSSQDSETKMLTQVYAWKPDYARIVDQVESAMKPEVKVSTTPAAKKESEKSKTQNKGIKSKTVVSPEAKEFL